MFDVINARGENLIQRKFNINVKQTKKNYLLHVQYLQITDLASASAM